ncbi:MAG: acyl-CoA desaturase [Planctomycetota bacterium]
MLAYELPKPRSAHLLLGLIAYPLTSLLPVAVTWGLLEAINAYYRPIPVLWLLLVAFTVRHTAGFVVTTLFHRSMAHDAFRFHPVLEWLLRLWTWFFVGTGARAFAIMHRAHHAYTDKEGDPHSPTKPGESLWTVARQTNRSYVDVLNRPEAYTRFAHGLPDDRLEALIEWDGKRNFGFRGVRVPLQILLWVGTLGWLFGPVAGVLVFLALLPTTIGGVVAVSIFTVNGLCHLVGYRSYEVDLTASNLFPIDVLTWGEVLHQNHHVFPGSANFAHKAWEWDPAYTVLWCMSKVGLVRDLKAPTPNLPPLPVSHSLSTSP